MTKNNRTGSSKKRPLVIGAVILLLLIPAAWNFGFFKADETKGGNIPTFRVRQGPLRISVTETGTIDAREKIIVKNEVEGKTSIISLVDEGTKVKKGDLLIELDASELLDQKVDQEIKVQNTEASFISARENQAVVENQARSDVDKAKLAYDFAQQDLEKYTKGEYPNQLKEAEAGITLAEEDVTRANEKLEWSRKLYTEKYISQTELQADELAQKKKVLDLELARNDLDLLKDYTHKRKLAQLESDVSQAEMALERTTRKARADVVEAKANLKAKEAEYNRQKDKLQKVEKQIEKTKIYAPADGLVIYATSSSGGGGPRGRTSEPLAEGQQVRERQDLIHLPTSKGFNAVVGVYEASLDKIRTGLPVIVTVDALSGERYTGRVTFIAPLPDPQSAFLNPDLKIYNTVVELDDNGKTDLLRSGMGCTAEIIVEQYEEATYVPIQAVMQVGGQPTVYVLDNNRLEPRIVDVGLDNNRMVRIISGLEPDVLVSLSPPLSQASVEQPVEDKISDIPPLPVDKKNETGPGVSGTVEEKQPSGPDQSGASQRENQPQGGNLMSRLDTDNDGKISRSEFPRGDDVFQRLDRDGDGFITAGELPSRPSGSTGSRSGTSGDSGRQALPQGEGSGSMRGGR